MLRKNWAQALTMANPVSLVGAKVRLRAELARREVAFAPTENGKRRKERPPCAVRRMRRQPTSDLFKA